MLLTEWKSRLLPPECCREIDAFRSVDKIKGRIDWTITGHPPPPIVGKDSHTAEEKPLEKKSQPLYVQSVSWRLCAYYCDNHLALFVDCDGPRGEKWNRSATARLSLYSADGRVVHNDSFLDSRPFTHDPESCSWGFPQFVSVELLEQEGCYLNESGSIRVSAEITVEAESFPMHETFVLTIEDFAEFANDGTKVCHTMPVMIRDRPLAMEAAIHNKTWLSLYLVYNDNEPIEEGNGGELDVTAYYVLESQSNMKNQLKDQLCFTFRRENVKQGVQYFARCSMVLDPAKGYLREDGSIVVTVIIFAKEARDGA